MKKLFRLIKAWLLHFDRRQREDGFTVQRSEEPHSCPYCHEEYKGNFCPQCGLPPDTDSIGKRGILMSFLEIWNLGNTKVLRTMKHLLWRPGYMILDWLNGRRSLYFSPVLTLITICFLFGLTLSIRGVQSQHVDPVQITIHEKDTTFSERTAIDSLFKAYVNQKGVNQNDSAATNMAKDSLDDEFKELVVAKSVFTVNDFLETYEKWIQDNYAYALMLGNLIFILVLPVCFRRSPHRPRTTLMEFFFIQLYVDSSIMLISTIWALFVGNVPIYGFSLYPIPNWLSIPVLIITYRQLFGHTLWGTTWRYLVVSLLNMILSVVIFLVIFTGLILFNLAKDMS
ncbi:MAG: DUF3667 domain-containing protein [Bacteroidaceae bacterium]|nr:DUF3667 domain-containing protein [Bacteroidaceae bacterium]